MEKLYGRIHHNTFGKERLLQEAMKAYLKLPQAVLYPTQANILIA